jgi:hypothetical protein
MILQSFRPGWQEKFESRLTALTKYFSELSLVEVERYHGMLRVKYHSDNTDIQEIADAVTYKIERESSKICEQCGSFGKRVEEHLSEKMCFCWKCYTLEIDRLLNGTVTQNYKERD